VEVALDRVRSAIETGQERDQIRADVAVDLLNLLGTLSQANSGNAEQQVTELRRKLRERVSEGSVDAARAEIVRNRLADLDQAVASG
jgi:hypothetical protein